MSRWLSGLLAVGALGAVMFAPSAAASESSAVTVYDSAEAWYTTPPASTCSSPIGCPPVTVPAGSGYPANTLHVAATAGQGTAVTYIEPDLSRVNAVSGTMTLPLASVAGNGNSDTAAATIEACLATAPFDDGNQGSTASPPAFACDVRGAVLPGSKSFRLDLTPFLRAWAAGQPDYGLALLPSPAPGATWHVAFDGRGLRGAAPIASELYLAPASEGVSAVPPTPPSAPAPPPPSTTPGPALPFPAAQAPSTPAPTASAPAPVYASPSLPKAAVTEPSFALPATRTLSPALPAPAEDIAGPGRANGFQYPEVMLLPLAFAIALMFAGRLLTSDATPKGERA